MSDRPNLGPLEIERKGRHVLLTVHCPDEYAAIQLYDELCLSAGDGQLRLELVTAIREEP